MVSMLDSEKEPILDSLEKKVAARCKLLVNCLFRGAGSLEQNHFTMKIINFKLLNEQGRHLHRECWDSRIYFDPATISLTKERIVCGHKKRTLVVIFLYHIM